MQLLVCVIRAGSEYRAIVSHCGQSQRASDRWGKLPLSLDMITAGGMHVRVCVCVGGGGDFGWESWLTDFMGNVCPHARDRARVSVRVISKNFEMVTNAEKAQSFCTCKNNTNISDIHRHKPSDLPGFGVFISCGNNNNNKKSLFCSLFPLSLFGAGCRLCFPRWMSLFFTVC